MNRRGSCGVALACLLGTGAMGRAHEFHLGVASGDCRAQNVVLWANCLTPGDVLLEVASDEGFASVVATRSLEARPDQNLILKVQVGGLVPASRYYYRFRHLTVGEDSPVGTFSTTPPEDEPGEFRFLYSGDSNAAAQPFWVLDHGREEAANFWFWAGDTIYADDVFNDLPVASDLAGYRAKYEQNRDSIVQNLMRECPVWVQWDDHEVANDYDGGDLESRLSREQVTAGYQAFFEYMPITDQALANDPWRTFRSFRYGSLAEFFILDCRQYRSADAGRGGGGPDPRAFLLPTLDIGAIIRMHDPARSMLGREQLDWLKQGLAGSSARWKFVLSSVPMTSLLYYPYDRWDGYDAERYDILRFIETKNIAGVVFLSADIHGNAYNPDLTHYLRNTLNEFFSGGVRVPEFIAGPIGTFTVRQELREVAAIVLNRPPEEVESDWLYQLGVEIFISQVRDRNRLAFVEADRYGYLVVDVKADGVTFTHKGISPGPSPLRPQLETLHTVTLQPNNPTTCGSGFLFPVFAMLCFSAAGRRLRHGAIRERDRTAGLSGTVAPDQSE